MVGKFHLIDIGVAFKNAREEVYFEQLSRLKCSQYLIENDSVLKTFEQSNSILLNNKLQGYNSNFLFFFNCNNVQIYHYLDFEYKTNVLYAEQLQSYSYAHQKVLVWNIEIYFSDT